MKWKVINPAKYRHQVTIRDERAAGRNTFGERVTVGSVVAVVWAEKSDWSGRELTEEQRETAEVLTKFVIRWRADILPDMQVVLGSDVYNIMSVLDWSGVHKELVLLCQRVVL